MMHRCGSIIFIVAAMALLVQSWNDNSTQHHHQHQHQRTRSRAKTLLPPPTSSSSSSASSRNKPNIVLILTDDQDVELGSLNFMPRTLEAIRNHGAEFRHAYVTTPMCCPSRSSLLTGMYVHNHHVFTNNDNCSSTAWQATHETRSFATYLSNAGYRTGYFGKYLNKYNGSYIPPGWREWGGLIMNSKYYNYSINMNGKKIKHGFDYTKDYYTDLIANDSIAFLRQSKKNNVNKPVMLTMSFPAPHGPEDSAPQYSHLFFNVTTHHTPSYDFAPNLDKQWILQITNKMKPIHREFTDLLMTKRLQTLQSVDAAVQRVVRELEALKELDNTYIVYTSDHGYHLGQFGLIKGKSFPFEFDVRVPFLVRGPGVEAGSVVDDIVLNIDLAPTFLDIAGVEQPPHMDGRSVLPLFLNTKRKRFHKWPDTFLIESSGRREQPDRARNRYSWLANQWNTTTSTSTMPPEVLSSSTTTMGTKDLYDSSETVPEADGDDTDDDDDDGAVTEEEDEPEPEPEQTQADVQLDNQLLPVGPLPSSKSQRLAVECYQESMQLPCKVGQKWFCQKEAGRWRKHKCKLQGFGVLPPAAATTQKWFKKCACITKDGLVYRKIPIVNAARTKRDLSMVDGILSSLLATTNHRVSKRDTLKHVENVIGDLQSELSGLVAVNASLLLPEERTVRINLDTNRISETLLPGCERMSNGHINCSSVVYHDRKSWRRSREHIDNEIHRLKMQLDNLKEIRRHLKHTKPVEDEEDGGTNGTTTDGGELPTVNNNLHAGQFDARFVNIPEYSTERFNVFETHKKRKRPLIEGAGKRKPHPHRHRHRLLPGTSTTEDYVSSTSASSTTEVTSDVTELSSTEGTSPTEPPPTSSVPRKEYCHCEPEEPYNTISTVDVDEKDVAREARRKQKEERLRKKARKMRKKAQLEKECLSEKIHCFRHDNDHWRTAPLWTAGPFCFCMNANNNTYNCLRTINATHNLLYCEFVTGLKTYFNLRIDPFELTNRYEQLRVEEKNYLRDQLRELMACKGRSCTLGSHSHHGHHQRGPPRRRRVEDFEGGLSTSYNDRHSRLIKIPKSWRRRQLSASSWRDRRKQHDIGEHSSSSFFSSSSSSSATAQQW